jgi:hypothetical protein
VCRTKSSSVCIFTEGGHSPSSPPQDYALDSTDEEGEPFWGGSRRVPTPLTFDPTDSLHMDFVVAAALLKVGSVAAFCAHIGLGAAYIRCVHFTWSRGFAG